MAKNIPESAKSVQSVFDNIIALNEEFSNNTKLSGGLKNSQRYAKGICLHYKDGELLFGLSRMVGFEGMSPEKYTEFKKDEDNQYIYRQEAKLPKEFISITQRDSTFETILTAYRSWLDKHNISLVFSDLQGIEFLITQNDLDAFLSSTDSEESGPKILTRELVEKTIDEYHKVGQQQFFQRDKISYDSPKQWFISPYKRGDNNIFPATPIVSVALNSVPGEKYKLGWGWSPGKKYSTCVLLHNLGYIVTTKDGTPIKESENNRKIPDGFDTLIKGKEWFQKIAENYFIIPAREENQQPFSITPLKIHEQIGFYQGLEDVIEALSDEKFHSNMGIKLVKQSNHNQRSHQILNFEFRKLVSETTNLIYYGPPGTGKTYTSVEKAVELCIDQEECDQINQISDERQKRQKIMNEYKKLTDNEQIEFVTFHQSFSYEEFVEGLRPTTNISEKTHSNQSGGFELKTRDGIFKNICNRAKSHESKNYVLIIDEINRANISKVFGELITLLEPDKRLGAENEIKVTLPYSGISEEKFGIPPNLHIIGTMNTADRSIALLDTALRRRFKFEEKMPDLNKIPESIEGLDLNLRELIAEINQRIESLYDREHQIGHAKLMKCKTKKDVEDTFRDYVIPLLAEYFFEDRGKIAQVLETKSIDESDYFEGCFLTATPLNPPNDSDEDSLENNLRWEVNKPFKFEKLQINDSE